MIERTAATSNVVEVLDRVLDKGIVIDAWVRLSLVGIELVTVQARVVVVSIATYLGYADVLADLRLAASPAPELGPQTGRVEVPRRGSDPSITAP